MNPLWSWTLATIGITGLYLAGRNNKTGWAIGFTAQFLWIIYAIHTRQHGFIITAAAYAWIYANNWHKWAQKERKAEKP